MLEERLKEIREELNSFEDELQKYTFLVELSAYIDPHQPELMTDQNLYPGCQSRVWVRYELRDGGFYMTSTSDTLIIRGVLYIMQELFNGLPPEEIAGAKLNFLEACGIAEHFSDTRTSGIQGLVDDVKRYCDTFAEMSGTD